MAIIDSFTKLAQGSFLDVRNDAVFASRSELDIADQVRDTFDYLATPGDVLGVYGDTITELDVTARQIIFEPTLIEKLTALHSPFRRSIQPSKAAFDAAGTLGSAFGNNTVFSMNPVADGTLANPLPFLGWVFRLNINDTLVGEGNVTLNCVSSGLSATYLVSNQARESVVCFLSHIQDYTMGSTLVTTFDNTTNETSVVTTNTQTLVGDQYTFFPFYVNPNYGASVTPTDVITTTPFTDSGNVVPGAVLSTPPSGAQTQSGGYIDINSTPWQNLSNQEWTVTGNNIIVYAYPLYMTRTLAALIDSLLSADRLGELASFIAAGFATQKSLITK